MVTTGLADQIIDSKRIHSAVTTDALLVPETKSILPLNMHVYFYTKE